MHQTCLLSGVSMELEDLTGRDQQAGGGRSAGLTGTWASKGSFDLAWVERECGAAGGGRRAWA